MKVAYFSAFRSYIAGTGKSLLFTSLFYSLWLVINQLTSANFDLQSFKERTIGIATLDGIDVEARISLFYRCILLFFCALSGLSIIGYFIFKKTPALLSSEETHIINYTSIAGMLLFVFKVFESPVYESLEIIYFLHKLMLASIILKAVFFKNNKISIYQFSIILSVATSLYFFIADCNNLAGYVTNPDFYFTTFTISCILLIVLNLFLKAKTSANKQHQLRLAAFTLLPILTLPFISVLKDEAFLVFKANNILLNNQLFIYLVLLIFVVLAIILRYKKGVKKELRSDKDQLAGSYFPLLIFSLLAYLSYSYYTDYYDEVFESGNVYLPIMEHKLFGTLSPIEKLNTHLFSDYFFGAIYSFFNGLKINEITLYDFLLAPISYTLYYYLLKFITRNEFVAFLCILLFPYAEAMLPEGFCLSILGIFALSKILGPKQSLKNYNIYFVTIIFLALWRIDLGFNCLLTMPLLLLYYNFRDSEFKINWKLLLRSFLIVFGSTIVLLCFASLYRGTNLFAKINYLINYCLSSQSYSYGVIGSSGLATYKMHYLIFPACVGLILVVLVLKHKQISKTKSQRLAYLSMLFICLFYLINFNRGLIRHSLFEGSDAYVASFIYLIIPGSVFVLFKRESNARKALIFLITAFFLIIVYRVPDIKGSTSVFEKLENKIKTTKNSSLAKIKSRIKNSPVQSEIRHKQFSDFIKKHCKTDETFIDFSNRPMLYFFSEKITPSWFYQNPLCIQNDYLQKRFIDDLNNYKTPYLLFSGISEPGYEGFDGVPNEIRHYRMAEYFYNNYKPYIIIENLRLWKNNKTKDDNLKDTLFKFYKGAETLTSLETINTKIKIKQNKKYIAKVITLNDQSSELKTLCNGVTFLSEKKHIKGNVDYYIIECKTSDCELMLGNENNKIKEFFVIECDYIPDYTSEKLITYDLKKLPHIWGTYDKELSNENILFENNNGDLLKKTGTFNIPQNIDRSTGNTIIITCKNNSNKTQKLSLAFGNSNETDKTVFLADILPSAKNEKYAIRVSSAYKWFSGNVNQINIITSDNSSVNVSKIQITKGE